MNLGDGLLFELENGKPKLILLNRGEKVQKNSQKQRPRLPSVLSCRQPSRVDTPRTEEQPVRKQNALNGSRQHKPGRGGALVGGWSQTITSSKNEVHHMPVKEVKTVVKVKPAKPQNVRHTQKPEEPHKKAEQMVTLYKPGSVSCLTNEQLQHILSTVQTNDEPLRTEVSERKADCNVGSAMREKKVPEDERAEAEIDKAPNTDKPSGGLFSWMEQRPSEDRATLEAKKAQWKKELDEQVAFKQKIHHSAPPRVQDEEGTERLVAVQSSISHKDLPAAIRSSLRVGECVPVDEAELTLEQKLEQRRRWLLELDKQREEMLERKRLEKLQQHQTEDQQRWASHFESLHRPALTPLFLSAEKPEAGPCDDRGESGVRSILHLCEEGSVRASVDMSSRGGQTARAGHLRTMTSLLDPAEIEERERRRLKQLEQQRAIELQVEERRQRREEEEAKRKRKEEEEEQRVQQESEKLQRQYERDVHQEKHKEQTSPNVEPSVKDSTEAPFLPRTNPHEESPELKVEPINVNQHRDTAVQTEEVHISESLIPEPIEEAPAVVPDRAQVLQMLQMLQKGFGADVYEPFARTERSKKDLKRPEWNTQRPSRRFVPASQRYPEELQRQRQESRLRRQAQLLSLQRNPSSNQNMNPTINPTTQHDHRVPETHRGSSSMEKDAQSTERGHSPVHRESPAPDFLPYVRTDEVFNLNTHDTPPGPQLLQKTQRQEEIIRGLAQLREGLLQKQRELESDLSRSRFDNDFRPFSRTLTYQHEL